MSSPAHSLQFSSLFSSCVSPPGSLPGLCQVKNPLSLLLQQRGDVLQQSWPAVDPKYLDVPDFVELFVMVGSHTLTPLLIVYTQLY